MHQNSSLEIHALSDFSENCFQNNVPVLHYLQRFALMIFQHNQAIKDMTRYIYVILLSVTCLHTVSKRHSNLVFSVTINVNDFLVHYTAKLSVHKVAICQSALKDNLPLNTCQNIC